MTGLLKSLRDRIASASSLTNALQTLGLPTCPIAFLGIAEHFKQETLAPPVGASTIFRLSIAKNHYFYPAPIGPYSWLFLIDALSLSAHAPFVDIEIGERGSSDHIGHFRLAVSADHASGENGPSLPAEEAGRTDLRAFLVPHHRWMLVPAQLPTAVVQAPSSPVLVASFGRTSMPIGQVQFTYSRRQPFTSSEIRAINSDPRAVRFATIELGCNQCESKYRAYAGLDRSQELERDGLVWQHDVQDDFRCGCGATTFSLQYVRESLHAILGRDAMITGQGVSFERRYGHEELARVFDEFRHLIAESTDEAPVQAFIERHPVLLARFSARKLLIKPPILGKHRADFATLDARGILTLIELERPAIPLFKDAKPERGHVYAQLGHAFQQAQDWLFEAHKHRAAVLEGMELSDAEVVDIRAVVIAGRTKEEERDYIRRQLFGMTQKLDFMTLDDLVDSAYQISRDLA